MDAKAADPRVVHGLDSSLNVAGMLCGASRRTDRRHGGASPATPAAATVFHGRPLTGPDDGQTRAVEHEMEALAGRDQSQTAPQILTAPGERRIDRGRRGRGASSRTERAGTLRLGAAGDGRGAAGSGRSRWRDPSSAAAHPACRSGGASRQRPLPRTTTPSHRRGERGPDCRPPNSQRGTSSYTWDGPSTASLQCGSCGGSREVRATPPHPHRAFMQQRRCSATCCGGSGRCRCRQADARHRQRSPIGEAMAHVWSGV